MKIRNAPELLLGLELFYTAFMDLTSSRELGYGEGPIRWKTILDYCEKHEIEGEQQEDVFYHVQHLDSAYLDWRAKKSKADRDASAKAKK